MSSQWYYNCDGRTGGPISQAQLQQMAGAGQLGPQHEVRRGATGPWCKAAAVKGLFPDAAVPQARPVAEPAPLAVAAADDLPFQFGPPAEEEADDAPPPGVFDFFAAAPAPAAPAVPAKPAAAKPAPPEDDSLPEVLHLDEPPPPPPPAPPPPPSPPVLVAVPPPAPEPPARVPEVVPRPAEPAPAFQVAEVAGTAVELLPDDTVRLLDGKTSFRLHRGWLTAVTKFAGGAGRTVYLRLSRLDGAVLEQRFEAGPARKGPHAVLSFRAGGLAAALLFTGADKPFRGFVEKVLLQAGGPSKHAAAPKD